MTDQEAQLRGEKARQILESPLWQEAWKVYEERILQEFRECKSDDTARLTQLKALHLAGTAAQKHLEAIVTDGKIAAQALTQERSRISRLFRS